MGLFLRFFGFPSPRGRGADVADDGLAAGMYVDVFHGVETGMAAMRRNCRNLPNADCGGPLSIGGSSGAGSNEMRTRANGMTQGYTK
jgi:hypothetical protein